MTTEPSLASRPTSARARAVTAVFDSLLTGLWTATRDLDHRPWRRRVARGAVLLALAPRAAAVLHEAGAQRDAGRTTPASGSEADADAQPTVPPAVVYGVAGMLAVVTLVASHRIEAAAVRDLRRRGVRHAGCVLGAGMAVAQLVATAGVAVAAQRRSA